MKRLDEPVLVDWLIKKLDPISEADPKVLAQYIIALLKNNAEEKMRDACLNQLDVFLQPDTSAFVGDLFAYLKESGMLTDEPAPPVQASGQCASKAGQAAAGASDKGKDREADRGRGREGRDRNERDGHHDSRGRRGDDRGRGSRRSPGTSERGSKRAYGEYDGKRAFSERERGSRDEPPSKHGRYHEPRGHDQALPRRNACRDFEEKGWCLRGDMCPYDHGPEVLKRDISMLKDQLPRGANPYLPPGMHPPREEEYDPTMPAIRSGSIDSHYGPMMHQRPPPPMNRPYPPMPPMAHGIRRDGPMMMHGGRPPMMMPGGPPGMHPRGPGPMHGPYGGPGGPGMHPRRPVSDPAGAGRGMGPRRGGDRGRGRGAGAHINGRAEAAEPQNGNQEGAEPPADRGGRGGGRGRGGRPFQAGHEEGPKSEVAIEVTHIPPADNNQERLTTHFSKFGTIVSIQSRYRGRPNAARVQFQSAAEAAKAFHSVEAVLNNRFIRVYYAPLEDGETSAPAPAPKKPEKELTEAQKRVLEDYKQKREMEKKAVEEKKERIGKVLEAQKAKAEAMQEKLARQKDLLAKLMDKTIDAAAKAEYKQQLKALQAEMSAMSVSRSEPAAPSTTPATSLLEKKLEEMRRAAASAGLNVGPGSMSRTTPPKSAPGAKTSIYISGGVTEADFADLIIHFAQFGELSPDLPVRTHAKGVLVTFVEPAAAKKASSHPGRFKGKPLRMVLYSPPVQAAAPAQTDNMKQASTEDLNAEDSERDDHGLEGGFREGNEDADDW